MKKGVKLLFIFICLLLFTLGAWLLMSNLQLKKSLRQLSAQQEQEIKNKINLRTRDIKKAVRKDLEEKYKADRVSYRVMIRRLELEKEKRKALEDALKGKTQKEGNK